LTAVPRGTGPEEGVDLDDAADVEDVVVDDLGTDTQTDAETEEP
jgi:hypothetical protein